MIKVSLVLSVIFFSCYFLQKTNSEVKALTKFALQESKQDTIAEKMLLYQRANGGWPQYKGNATDYRKKITDEHKAQLLKDKKLPYATIDDKSTTYEINYLVKAYAETRNPAYLKAAENGINYLLAAQYPNGGWPQSFPDTSSYHKHITFNDGAMTDALGVLRNTADKKDGYQFVAKPLISKAKTAVDKGINCILKAQYYQNGKLTAWGAQHHYKTLQPAAARKFELASLSSSESVAVLDFLMSIPNPTSEIKRAVHAAVIWLEAVKIKGITTQRVQDASQPSGRDVKVVENPQAVSWARFYELETNKPIFTGRDGIKRYALAEIENERRVGYSWYNTRPAKLLSTDYPAWVKKWGK